MNWPSEIVRYFFRNEFGLPELTHEQLQQMEYKPLPLSELCAWGHAPKGVPFTWETLSKHAIIPGRLGNSRGPSIFEIGWDNIQSQYENPVIAVEKGKREFYWKPGEKKPYVDGI